MKYLIDTHTLIWIASENPKLSEKVKRLYLEPKNEIYLSIASIWEIAIKMSLGKISLGENLESFITNHIKGNSIKILDIKVSHILIVEKLPFHHKDPFDRLIISQSIEEEIPVLGKDSIFDFYESKRIW